MSNDGNDKRINPWLYCCFVAGTTVFSIWFYTASGNKDWSLHLGLWVSLNTLVPLGIVLMLAASMHLALVVTKMLPRRWQNTSTELCIAFIALAFFVFFTWISLGRPDPGNFPY